MKSKLVKFEENKQRTNVIEPEKNIFNWIKGNWHSQFFKNNAPIVLEIGCGKGEYTVGLARENPDQNYVGIDIKGARIWKGSKLAEEESLPNAGFLRIRVLEIENFFETDEVDEIWITFPDPRPKKRDIKRRLTSPRFIELYKNIMKSGGLLHLKTDNQQFFDYTLEQFQNREDVCDLKFTYDLYASDLLAQHQGIKTFYEESFLKQGIKIKYLQCRIV